ncbi:PDR/VanB family oxidoreductase [Saccharopolyspora elongata]|uniref:Oxidoreductase n=1 Tax=Saccharopolyspora elongata TaxID=2530387 RepID=A0A4R4Y5U3_9PSEU|nr:PDR/VanB family oxidoreductase [Saccharopolyspora elongata]TDD39616.1 oxidoreductase [Saccharopolyspora elongata]
MIAQEIDVWRTVVVEATDSRADDVVALTLRDPEGQHLPAWEPGAHIDVDLGPGLIRQYSLCGDPRTADRWRIAVLREPRGRGGSARIHDHVRVGDRLRVRGPRNRFPLADAERYFLVAGGIGITPILAMATKVAALGRPWTLLYGGRTRSSMAFLDELTALPGGELIIVPQDEFGLPDLDRYLAVPADGTVVYCCGPGPMLSAVEQACGAWPAGSLHRERFSAEVPQPDADSGSFEVVLKRSGLRLAVPEHEPLLDVLEASGIEIDNSCRAGICGTCVVGVVSGEPDHRDDVLTDEERERGEIMLPCVSRSRGRVLVLDL